jgi:hypothetical protein
MFRQDAELLNGCAEFLALARMSTRGNAAVPPGGAGQPFERSVARCR